MDDELRKVAAAFEGCLPSDGEVSTFRIDGLDRIGVPVVQANLIVPGEPATIGYGYGASEIEARVGALGELCEEVHVGRTVAHAERHEASRDELMRTVGERGVVDPLTLCLPAGSGYSGALELEWIAARRWPSGETVLVPREWVAAYSYQLDTPARLITPITNGLGAGFDLGHAIGHGLMELLQRDGNVIGYRALDQGIVVEVDTDEGPEVAALFGHLRSLGINATVKLAATDFGLTNLYVVGDDTGAVAAPLQISSCGEAVHPDRSRALRKALLEFVGSRSRKVATHGPIPAARAVMPEAYVAKQIEIALLGEENRALLAMTEWVGQDVGTLRGRLRGVFAESSRVRLSELPTVAAGAVADSSARLALLTERLASEGLDVLWVDCSPPDSPVKVVKVIVPGLESETMSYHRIGWRGVRRLRARGDRLLLDAPAAGALRVRLTAADEARAGGPAWFDAASADAMVDRLYPMYRECGPFAAQLMMQRQQQAA